MPLFQYRAARSSGQLVEGRLEAPDGRAAILRLQSDGLIPIRADPVGAPRVSRWFKGASRGLGRQHPDIVAITRGLQTLLGAGLTLDRALLLLAEGTDAPADTSFLENLLRTTKSGGSLADALRPHTRILPPYYLGMVRAGETGGSLVAVLDQLATAMEQERALKETIRSALYYPAFVMVVAVCSLVILLVFVVPEFGALLAHSSAERPASMAVFLTLSAVLRGYWWALLLTALLAVVAWQRIMRTEAARRWHDRTLLGLPVIGNLQCRIDSARAARVLGTLLAGGVDIAQAVSIAADSTANHVLGDALRSTILELRRGRNLSEALRATDRYPRLLVEMVRIGEESGQLDQLLLRTANTYEAEIKRDTARAVAMLVPAVTVLLGIVVGVFVTSMLSAILDSYRIPT